MMLMIVMINVDYDNCDDDDVYSIDNYDDDVYNNEYYGDDRCYVYNVMIMMVKMLLTGKFLVMISITFITYYHYHYQT